jgi:outer membrane immunogenic protein
MTRGGIPGTFGNGVNACSPGGGFPCFQTPGTGGIGSPGLEAEAVDSSSVKLGWDGTIRGKLGTLITPTILFYGTGGVAFQQVSVNARCDASADSWCFTAANQTFSDVRIGWTAGLGLEAVLSGNWIGKVEARYADFGNYRNVFFAGTGDDVATSVRVQTVTALAGVTYKFGPGPVIAKY